MHERPGIARAASAPAATERAAAGSARDSRDPGTARARCAARQTVATDACARAGRRTRCANLVLRTSRAVLTAAARERQQHQRQQPRALHGLGYSSRGSRRFGANVLWLCPVLAAAVSSVA